MRFIANTSVLAAAVIVAFPAVKCIAQQPRTEEPLRASNTANRIAVSVIVRDKRGAPVTGLASADLTLTDNGHLQVIEDLRGGPDNPLRVGMLVDTSRGMLRAMDSERKAVEGFVDLILPVASSGATSPVQAFLIHFDREVELLEDFTASRDKLHSDLEQLSPTQRTGNTEGPETTDSDSSRRNLRSGSPQLYDAIFLASNDVMKSTRGRKALIIFSNGVDRGSKESLNESIEAAERASTPVYTIYFRGDEQRTEGAVPGGRRRGGMGGGWPGTGGGWPGGYPGGGRGSRMPQVDGRKIMQQIAYRTGGVYFEAKKTAELGDIYSQIASVLRGQYLLTYVPDKVSGDAEFHKIELKAAKEELTVTAPEGYFATRDESK